MSTIAQLVDEALEVVRSQDDTKVTVERDDEGQVTVNVSAGRNRYSSKRSSMVFSLSLPEDLMTKVMDGDVALADIDWEELNQPDPPPALDDDEIYEIIAELEQRVQYAPHGKVKSSNEIKKLIRILNKHREAGHTDA